ncbi:hypothetical protein GCM10027586_00710 [Kineococcus gypseus]|uniref:hypothetical protein n=1 Tax=Kineococcus gypseus TaxID=1637102 RepID=UPI003D7D7983
MPVTVRTLVGRVLDASQKPTLSGEYRFTPSAELRTSEGVIVPERAIRVRFRSGTDGMAGTFAVQLVANDSEGLRPQGTTYREELYLDSQPSRPVTSRHIVVSRQGSGSIDLAALPEVAPPGQPVVYASLGYVAEYVRTALLQAALGTVDLDGYVTDGELQQALEGLGGGSAPDLSGYVTTAENDAQIMVEDPANPGLYVPAKFRAGSTNPEVAQPGIGPHLWIDPADFGGGGGSGGGGGPITADQITDAGTTGKALVRAGTQAAARTAIGAVGGWADLGTVPSSALPPLAVNDTFTVASQAAMLALTAQRGDIAVRTDVGRTFILTADTPATLSAWVELAAVGQVTSVNGQTGAVTVTGGSTTLTLAEMTSWADDPIEAGVDLVPAGRHVPAAMSVWVCADVSATPPVASVPVQLQAWRAGALVTLGSVTIPVGTYRVPFPSQIALQANDLLFAVTTASGGLGLCLRFRLDAAWTVPATAPGKPGDPQVSVTGEVATLTWTLGSPAALSHVVYCNPGNGEDVYAVGSGYRGTGAMVRGHRDGASYAVEATIPGRGSGISAFKTVAGTVATPPAAGYTLATPTYPGTDTDIGTSGDFIVGAKNNGATAQITAGNLLTLRNGTVSGNASNIGVRIAKLAMSTSKRSGFTFFETVYLPDTSAALWLIASPDLDPVQTNNRMIRVEIFNTAIRVGAKAPNVIFGAGANGGYRTLYRQGTTDESSYTIPGIGTPGIDVFLDVQPGTTAGTMVVRTYTAEAESGLHAGDAGTTLVGIYDLSAAQVDALFGAAGAETTGWSMHVANGSSNTNGTVRPVRFGPTAGLKQVA